jgi:RimJ/RimL family protein N-acetyltransferase
VDGLRLENWSAADLWLVTALNGDPAMMRHLGGPESPSKLAERQEKYSRPGSGMFKIVLDGEAVGSVGYWERPEGDSTVWEAGWAVLPAFQGRGIATAAMALLVARARAERRHRFMHAYPSIENPASNAICRKLGFELLGPQDFEYPPGSGNVLRCNDWRLELWAAEAEGA